MEGRILKMQIRRIVIASSLLCIAAGIPGCRQTPRAPSDRTIITSFYPIYIETINIAGGVPDVRVVNMTRPTTGCLHDYQMTPDDMAALERASVFVVNGAGMEAFLDKVIKQRPDLRIIDASRDILLVSNGQARDAGPNPHVWVSVSRAMEQVRAIAAGLAAWDTAHAALYGANAARYALRLDSLRIRMHAALDNLPRREIVTMHEAFAYFAAEFNLRVAATIEREPGSGPSAADLASIIRLVNARGITAVFSEPQYPAESAGAIAHETGARVYTLDPAVTGPLDKDAYIRIMDANRVVLAGALR